MTLQTILVVYLQAPAQQPGVVLSQQMAIGLSRTITTICVLEINSDYFMISIACYVIVVVGILKI